MKQLATTFDRIAVPANILCIDQFSNLGGGQRSLLDLLPAFHEQGWRPSVAIPGDGPFGAMIRSRGYRIHNLACRSYSSRRKPLIQFLRYALELPALIDSLTELVESHETDLLYVNGPRLVPPAAWVAWRKGIPLVFHCHNRLLQRSAITLTGVALELASAQVIACCRYAADPLREYVAPERLHVVYNGVAEMSSERLHSAQRSRRIGVVGRVEREKGQLQFVEAARLISRKVPDCRFSVIGTPMFSGLDYYRKVVASGCGLPIDFVDWQDNMAKIYSGLDVLVVPSSAVEATTRVILEAYSARVPVVAFPVGGIPEIVRDEQTGFLAESATVEALAQRVISVLQMDQARLTSVVRRARSDWRHRFTLGAYRNSVCTVLAQAMQPLFQSSCDELRTMAGLATD